MIPLRTAFALIVTSAMVSCTTPPMTDQGRLAQIFSEYVGNDVPGAAVLVIQDGQKELKGTFGMANLDRRERLDQTPTSDSPP